MHLPILLSLLPLAATVGDLRDLREDLLAVDRWDGRRHQVSDARVGQLERRLARFLELPSELRVRLTTSSGHRREVAKPDQVGVVVVHRDSGAELGMYMVPWSGDCVSLSGMHFSGGDAGDCLVHEGRSSYPRALLAPYFEELARVAGVATQERFPFSLLTPMGGPREGNPPAARVEVHLRAGQPEAEASVSATVELPLAEADPAQPDELARFRPWIRVGELPGALDRCLELVEGIRLDFPHSIRIAPDARERGLFQLNLDPYVRDQHPLPIRCALRPGREPGADWSVLDRWGRLEMGQLPLASLVALVNDLARTLIAADRRIGALGLAWDAEAGEARALLLSVEPDVVWEAQRGRLHLWSLAPGKAPRRLETLELGTLEPGRPGPGLHHARVACAPDGRELRLEVRDGEIFHAEPKPPVLRFDGVDYALVGGKGMN